MTKRKTTVLIADDALQLLDLVTLHRARELRRTEGQRWQTGSSFTLDCDCFVIDRTSLPADRMLCFRIYRDTIYRLRLHQLHSCILFLHLKEDSHIW